jgi:release factor glutamine methyltransferase
MNTTLTVTVSLSPSAMYEVSEDSYLLRNALVDADVSGGTAVDIGVGSGVITDLLCGRFDDVVGVDVDAEAVRHCRGRFADTENVRIVESDLFDDVPCVEPDLITCNPPYLPSTPGEDGSVALDGGETGIEFTKRFLDEASSWLSGSGEVFFVASSKADMDGLETYLDASWSWDVVADTRYFFETLYVLRARPAD